MFFFSKPQFPHQFIILLQKNTSYFAFFFNFYEVFLNMGPSGCQKEQLHGEDLMFIFENLNFTFRFSYFFSPGPPWDPRGDPRCDKISSISEIWPALWFFHVFVFAPGCFFHVVFRPGVFSHVFYSNHIIKSYYKIIL